MVWTSGVSVALQVAALHLDSEDLLFLDGCELHPRKLHRAEASAAAATASLAADGSDAVSSASTAPSAAAKTIASLNRLLNTVANSAGSLVDD